MGALSLNSILLFILVVPFIMGFRISPGETPYVLFGLIFLGLLGNVIVDVVKLRKDLYYKLKYFILWFVIIAAIGGAFISVIIVRHQTAPVYSVHDSVIQIEAGIRYFLDGKNPYATTYFDTPLKDWNYSDKETNPALYHLVYLPLNILFSLPFYFVSNHAIGYFDARIPVYILFLASLIIALLVPREPDKKILFVSLLAFNPAILSYTLEGRTDMLSIGFIMIGLYFFYKQFFVLSAVPFALAFAIKQSVWPLFPFYAAYLYFKEKNKKRVFMHVAIFVVIFLFINAPFFLWDSDAFIGSTISYLSGMSEHSYPISGYGFGSLLHELGVIKNMHAYYPFIIWQALIGIPLIIILIKFLKKRNSARMMILCYGVFLFVYWYFSRYFNNSHLGYLSMLFIIAYFWPEDK